MLGLLLASMGTKHNDNFIRDRKCLRRVFKGIRNQQEGRKMRIL